MTLNVKLDCVFFHFKSTILCFVTHLSTLLKEQSVISFSFLISMVHRDFLSMLWIILSFFLSVDVLLKAVGDTPIMKTKKWSVEKGRTVQSLAQFISRFLKLEPSEQLVCYSPHHDQLPSLKSSVRQSGLSLLCQTTVPLTKEHNHKLFPVWKLLKDIHIET